MNGELPRELQGFSWAAFLWGGVWAAAYRVWIGLFAFVPVFGFIMNVMLGIRGAQWAYLNGAIPDVARFKRAQRTWVIVWAALSIVAIPGVGVVSALAIYGVKKYVTNAKQAEARNALGAMARGMATCGAHGDLPATSQWIPADLSTVAGKKYQSAASDWSTEAAFSCSGFALSDPQYFRYRWRQVTQQSGEFEAEADLNADGITDNVMQQGVHCTAGQCEVELLLSNEPSPSR